MRPGVHQHDCHRADAVLVGSEQRLARGIFVQGRQLGAIGGDPPADLRHPLMQQVRKAHGEVEQPRPRLIADP